MSEETEIYELTITPIPPDTVQSARKNIETLIEGQLRASGQDALLSSGQLQLVAEQTFPHDATTTTLMVMAGTEMAKTAFKEVVLPLLKRHFGLEEKAGKKHKDNVKDKSDKQGEQTAS